MAKCVIEECEEEAEGAGVPWCQKHFDEFGDFLDEHPMISLESLIKADGRIPK